MLYTQLQYKKVCFKTGFKKLLPPSHTQCRINNSSKCSNCGGPTVCCNKSYLLH